MEAELIYARDDKDKDISTLSLQDQIATDFNVSRPAVKTRNKGRASDILSRVAAVIGIGLSKGGIVSGDTVGYSTRGRGAGVVWVVNQSSNLIG